MFCFKIIEQIFTIQLIYTLKKGGICRILRDRERGKNWQKRKRMELEEPKRSMDWKGRMNVLSTHIYVHSQRVCVCVIIHTSKMHSYNEYTNTHLHTYTKRGNFKCRNLKNYKFCNLFIQH